MIGLTAVGDAYAAGWEFVLPENRPDHDWSGYVANPQIAGALPGRYTDDTIRTVVNARVIASGLWQDPLAYVREMKRAFSEDQRGGWSRSFRAFLVSQISQPDEKWLTSVIGRDTNGALMGAPVTALLGSVADVMTAAKTQALVTHSAKAARYASIIALAGFGLRTGACDRDGIFRWLRAEAPVTSSVIRGYELDAQGEVDMSAKATCAAILGCLSRHDSLRGIMDEVIRRGGDTDSVAAGAFGIAAMAPGIYRNDLPGWAWDDLEGGDGAGIERIVATESALAHCGLDVGTTLLPFIMDRDFPSL